MGSEEERGTWHDQLLPRVLGKWLVSGSVQVRLEEVGQDQSLTYSARSCAELTSGAAHGLAA